MAEISLGHFKFDKQDARVTPKHVVGGAYIVFWSVVLSVSEVPNIGPGFKVSVNYVVPPSREQWVVWFFYDYIRERMLPDLGKASEDTLERFSLLDRGELAAVCSSVGPIISKFFEENPL